MELLTILWLALMVVFLVTEAATVTMVSLWFAAGALTALVASLLHAPGLASGGAVSCRFRIAAGSPAAYGPEALHPQAEQDQCGCHRRFQRLRHRGY